VIRTSASPIAYHPAVDERVTVDFAWQVVGGVRLDSNCRHWSSMNSRRLLVPGDLPPGRQPTVLQELVTDTVSLGGPEQDDTFGRFSKRSSWAPARWMEQH